MTVFQEHNAKVRFIQRMDNKYDYLAFKFFCEENGFEVLPFAYYPLIIDETFVYELDEHGKALNAPPDTTLVNQDSPQKSSCCGGGAVR